jgi:hypothetical protein
MNRRIIIILVVLMGIICSISAVSAHEGMQNPIVTIDDLQTGDEISGDVNLNVSVHWHNSRNKVNFTAEHIETNTKYLDGEGSNTKPNSNSDGWSFSWDTSNAPNGDYWLTVTATDNTGLSGKTEMRLVLNNIPKESKIVLEDAIAPVNKSTNVIAKLYDIDSIPLKNKNIEFSIDGESRSAKTTSSGEALISFTPKEIKDYNIMVKFNGDYRHLSSQQSVVLKVIQNVTVVTVNDVSGNNKEKILLKANLKVPGAFNSSANKKIDFYVNSNHVGSAFTDENGDAKLNYTISEDGGSYIYYAKYQNGSNVNFTSYAKLFVPESEISVDMSAVTYSTDGIFTVGGRFKIILQINNKGHDDAQNTMFRYDVPNSLKYIESTASQGKTTFNQDTREFLWNVGDVSVGSQKVEILFQVLSAGRINLTGKISTDTFDKSIDNAISTRVLTVNTYKLKGMNLVKYYTGSGKYKVSVQTSDGKSVSGASVHININGQTLKLQTNSKGFVELDVNLRAGKYTVKVKCNSLSISNSIVIKPILITKNIGKKKSKVVKFTAKVLNNKGKVVKNKKVTFKVKGKKYKAKTNKKGVATLKLKNLKVGKYVVNTSCGKSSVKNTIKIK